MQARIAIGGDIIFGKGVSQIARARGLGYLFEPIAPLLRDCLLYTSPSPRDS